MKNFIKEVLRKTIALLLIIITLPLQFIIAILILIELKEFPLFFQERGLTVEKNRFTIIKFKTISSKQKTKIPHNNIDNIFYIKSSDVQIKSFLKILRITGLDELPQLYNILIGNMNFIGPRPLMIEELEIVKKSYPDYYNYRNKINSKPGLTGLWQVIGDRKKGVHELIGLELFYELNKNFNLNSKIIFYTLLLLFSGSNSDAIISRLNFISKFSKNKINRFKIRHIENETSLLSFHISLPENWWTTNYSLECKRTDEKKTLRIVKIKRK